MLYRASDRDTARLGLAVAKKRLKRAVDRNRIKRLIRESFRQHRAILGGLDIVVLVKAGIEQADNRALLRALQRHWRHLSRDARP